MENKAVARTGEVIFAHIDRVFGSDAAFERAANLPPKTVNNWRRGRSSSYMKMLPELAALFGVSTHALLGEEGEAASPALTAEERELLTMFRATAGLNAREKSALAATIRNTIDLYLASREAGRERGTRKHPR